MEDVARALAEVMLALVAVLGLGVAALALAAFARRGPFEALPRELALALGAIGLGAASAAFAGASREPWLLPVALGWAVLAALSAARGLARLP